MEEEQDLSRGSRGCSISGGRVSPPPPLPELKEEGAGAGASSAGQQEAQDVGARSAPSWADLEADLFPGAAYLGILELGRAACTAGCIIWDLSTNLDLARFMCKHSLVPLHPQVDLNPPVGFAQLELPAFHAIPGAP